jgi:hypothetical protein
MLFSYASTDYADQNIRGREGKVPAGIKVALRKPTLAIGVICEIYG